MIVERIEKVFLILRFKIIRYNFEIGIGKIILDWRIDYRVVVWYRGVVGSRVENGFEIIGW